MSNKGPHTNGSQFFICLDKAPHLNGVYVAFGKIINSEEVLKEMEKVATKGNGTPEDTVQIVNCGQLE